MPATWELLEETDARERLETFVGNVAAAGEVESWDEFLAVVGDTELPTAIRSLVDQQGQPIPKYPGQIQIKTKNSTRTLVAYKSPSFHSGGIKAGIQRSSRWFSLRPQPESSVLFTTPDITDAMSKERTTKTTFISILRSYQPDYWKVDEAVYHSPLKLDENRVTTFAAMDIKARIKTPEALNDFLRISSRLVADLLAITA